MAKNILAPLGITAAALGIDAGIQKKKKKKRFTKKNFKACVRYSWSNLYFQPNDSPSKTMKNVFFYFI